MKRIALAVAAMILVTGCSRSVSQSYSPAGEGGEPWYIAGTYKHGIFTDHVTISINGKEVIDSPWVNDPTKNEFSTTYRDKTVEVSCATGELGLRSGKCSVFIAGSKAVVLVF
jgi:hypothetical protein